MALLDNASLMQGLFGVPGGPPASLLAGMQLPANVMSLLNPAAAAFNTPAVPAPTLGATPSQLLAAARAPGAGPDPTTMSPMARATQIGDLLNHNAYGTADPTHLGILGSAGFPSFSDPRMIHGYLATMAQQGDETALEQLRRMLQGGWSWGSYGNDLGGGLGGMGGNIGGGQSAGGAHASGTTGIDAELAAASAAADAASGAGMGGPDVAGAANEVNGNMGGLY